MAKYLFSVLFFFNINSVFAQSFLLVKDPSIRNIINENAQIEKLAEGFQFIEGPVWLSDNRLIFSDIPANKVYVYTKETGAITYLEPSGNSNGLGVTENGILLCQHSERQLAFSNWGEGYTSLVSTYEGKKFNSPNDLVIHSDGSIYFTDPAWGLTQQEKDPSKEIPYQGVYRFADGKVTLVDNSLSSPNGIALSPDEKWLYVANLDKITNEKYWVKYKVKKDGSTGGKKLFADASKSLEKGGPDGMAVDMEGNVYCTGPGGVLIFDENGTYLGLIRFPEQPANICFGEEDGKTLFATARTGLYCIRLNISGYTPIYNVNLMIDHD
jgi:gluconolactonase